MPPKKQQVKKNYNEDDDGEYTDAGGFGLDLTAEGKSIVAAIRADLLSLEEKFVLLLLEKNNEVDALKLAVDRMGKKIDMLEERAEDADSYEGGMHLSSRVMEFRRLPLVRTARAFYVN